MSKLLLLSALICAASSKGLIYDEAYYECFYWDAAAEAYVMGSYVAALADAASTSDADAVAYNYAFDVTFDAYDGCD
jgi:hypothetical protein